jgi:ribosomal protection tetracycline resistance protein
MQTLNLGILAHLDAGKTTLTERLLYAAGVIDEIGSVDDGSTQTDSLALERQRGITIKSAVVSFVIDDVTVNLIDTPGHPDFIAEVERVLSVLDGAVLVISAVEGVQSRTRVLMRTLQRLRIPTLIFVNKIDRGGAQYERILQDTAEKLTPAIIAMGSAHGLGTRSPGFTPYGAADVAFAARLADLLAGRDDAFLSAYVDDETTVSYGHLRAELAAQTRQALVHPVFFGSAITGAGVDALIAGVTELLPAAEGDVDGPVSGTVFKVERGPAGEKIAYVRMFSGTVRARRLLRDVSREGHRSTCSTGLSGAACVGRRGQIGKLWGWRYPDRRRDRQSRATGSPLRPPTLESVILPAPTEVR